jgi:hypothetical protein
MARRPRRRTVPLHAAPPARTEWAVTAAQQAADLVHFLRQQEDIAAQMALPHAIGALHHLLYGIGNVPGNRAGALAEMVAVRGLRVDSALLTLGC